MDRYREMKRRYQAYEADLGMVIAAANHDSRKAWQQEHDCGNQEFFDKLEEAKARLHTFGFMHSALASAIDDAEEDVAEQKGRKKEILGWEFRQWLQGWKPITSVAEKYMHRYMAEDGKK